MSEHVVTYTIVPFGARYRCTILVDNYPIEKNFFYHVRDAEVWCRKQVATLQANLK